MIHNESGAPLSSEIHPNPLQEVTHAKAGLRQELQMHCGPSQQCERAACMKPAALQNSETLADYRHGAFIEVPKRPADSFAASPPSNHRSAPLILLTPD